MPDSTAAPAPPAAHPSPGAVRFAIIYPVFLLSGGAAILYQLVWQRALFTLYGTNIESVTVVVTAFMVGLGLGSLAGGAVSSDPRRPLLLYFGLCETGIGCFGLVSLDLFHFTARLGSGGSLLAVSLIAFLLVLFPTMLMGATLPLLVARAVHLSHNVGRSVGMLYFINTLGSALGALLATWQLLRLLGERHTVTVAAAVNLLVGGSVIGYHLLSRPRPRSSR